MTFPVGMSLGRSNPAPWRRAVAVLLFFSFFWVSYVSQTHIHGQPVNGAVTAIAKLVRGDGQAVKIPGRQYPGDPADCPLCQAVTMGGMAVMPLLIALAVILFHTVRPELPKITRAGPTDHLGHAHQTRGPPRF